MKKQRSLKMDPELDAAVLKAYPAETVTESYSKALAYVIRSEHAGNTQQQGDTQEIREGMVKLQSMILQLKQEHEGLKKVVEDNLPE